MANDLRSFEKAIDDLREAEPKATREAAELILLGRIAQGLEQGALTLDEAQALDERLGELRAKHADALDLVGGIDVPAPQEKGYYKGRKKKNESAQTETTLSVAGMTEAQAQEATEALAFEVVADADIKGTGDVSNLDMTVIPKRVDEFINHFSNKNKKGTLTEEDRQMWRRWQLVRDNIYEEDGQTVSYNAPLMDRVRRFFAERGVVQTTVEPEEEVEGDEVNPAGDIAAHVRRSFEFSGKETAKANIRLMMATQRKISHYNEKGNRIAETGDFLGMPRFVNSDRLWKRVQRALSGLEHDYQDGEQQTVWKKMQANLKELANREGDLAPNIQYLLSQIQSAPKWKKTQFVNAFRLTNQNFHDVRYDPSGRDMVVKFLSARTQSGKSNILRQWEEEFKESGIFQDGSFNDEYVRETIDAFKEAKKLALDNDSNLEEAVEKLAKAISRVGIDVSSSDVKYHASKFQMGSKRDNLGVMVGKLSSFFAPTSNKKNRSLNLYRMSSRSENRQFDGEEMIQQEFIVRKHDGLRALAESYAERHHEYADDTTMGPEGRPYWINSRVSELQSVARRLSDGADLVGQLASIPYNMGSQWIQKMNRIVEKGGTPDFRIDTAGQFEEFGEMGQKPSGMTASDRMFMDLNSVLRGVLPGRNSRFPTLNMADQDTQQFVVPGKKSPNTLEGTTNITESLPRASVSLSVKQEDKVNRGVKELLVRTSSEAEEIGISKGETKVAKIGGRLYRVENLGLKESKEIGDREKVLDQIGREEDEEVSQNIESWMKGGKRYVYSLEPVSRRDDLDVSDTVVDIFRGYYQDEVRRMQQARKHVFGKEGTDPTNGSLDYEDHVAHYHYKLDGEERVYWETVEINGEKRQVPAGNAFKNFLFHGLSFEQLMEDAPQQAERLFNAKGLALTNQDPDVGDLIESHIREALNREVRRQVQEFIDKGLLRELGGKVALAGRTDILHHEIRSYYEDYYGLMGEDALLAAIGDFTINSLVSDIEQTKIFHGDPAAYKSFRDMRKRTKGGSADGLRMDLSAEGVQGEDTIDEFFNVAVLHDIVKKSEFYDHWMEELREMVGKEEAERILEAYEEVEVTDAQGYITLDRYEQILRGTGNWKPDMQEAFNRLRAGETNMEDVQIALQPIKGVHFENTMENGLSIPVYLKYSQMPLIPGMIEGTPLEGLLEKMEAQDVDEAVFTTGTKVGARGPTQVFNSDGSFREDTKLSPFQLSNRSWKLKVETDTKRAHQELIGSQQKKVIHHMPKEGVTYDVDGEETTAQELHQAIHRSYGALSDLGWEDLRVRWNISENGTIQNVEGFMSDMLSRFEERGAADNLLKALETRSDGNPRIPLSATGFSGDIVSMLTSELEKATIKNRALGNSYIQMSSAGFQTTGEDYSVEDLRERGHVYGELAPPRVADDGSLLPGSIFLPSWFKNKIPGTSQMMDEQLRGTFEDNPELLEAVIYRIPTQSNSSIDAVQIAGFLPESAGDTIVVYDEVTARTGSDFDIDKMYAMLPSWETDEEGNLQAVPYLNEENSTVEERYEKWIRDRPAEEVSQKVQNRRKEVNDKINRQFEALKPDMDQASAAMWDLEKEIISIIEGVEQTLDTDTEYLSGQFAALESWMTEEGMTDAALRVQQMHDLAGRLIEEQSGDSEYGKMIQDILENIQKSIENQFSEIEGIELGEFISSMTEEHSERASSMWESFKSERTEIIRDAIGAPTLSQFEERPIHQQNTVRALSNRILRLYHAAFRAPESFEEVINPLGSESLKPLANEFRESVEGVESGLEELTYRRQAANKNTFLSGKNLVGIIANHLVDHALIQNLDLRLDEDLGVGNTHPEGTTAMSERKDVEGATIMDILSAAFDGAVDVAKDPFIFFLNMNTITANTALMLIRAGAGKNFTFSFLTQEGIKDYVEAVKKGNSEITAEDRYELVDRLREKYEMLANRAIKHNMNELLERYGDGVRDYLTGLMKGPDEEDISPGEGQSVIEAAEEAIEEDPQEWIKRYLKSSVDVSDTSQLETDRKASGSRNAEYLIRQQQYIYQYEDWQRKANQFSDTVRSTKVDTGIGRGVFDNFEAIRRIEEVYDNGNGILKGYERKFSETMIGNYLSNGLSTAIPVLRSFFAEATPRFISATQSIASQIPDNEGTRTERLEAIKTELMAYLMSGSELAASPEKLQEMISGGRSMVNRLKSFRSSNSPVRDNPLINHFWFEKRDGYHFLKGDMRHLSDNEIDRLSRSWTELLSHGNADVQAFAQDLVQYAYHTSGMKRGPFTFHRLIPTEYFEEIGMNTYMEKAKKALEGDKDLTGAIDQVLRHSYDNEMLVPRIEPYMVSKGIVNPRQPGMNMRLQHPDFENGQYLHLNEDPRFLSKLMTDDGKMAPYVVVKDIQGEDALFRHMGYHEDKPLYTRAQKQGYRSRGRKIYEYNTEGYAEDSVINDQKESDDRNKINLRDSLEEPKSYPGISRDVAGSMEEKSAEMTEAIINDRLDEHLC